MDNIKFGNFIAQRRKELGLSQQDLADFLFVSVPTISKWESGKREPDLILLGSIAKKLNLDVECLLKCEIKNFTSDNELEFDIHRFANYLRHLRTLNNYSLVTLADKIDIRYQTISKWENGESVPNIDTFVKLSELYNVSLNELYFGKKDDVKIVQEKIIEHQKYSKGNIILFFVSIFCLVISSLFMIITIDNKNKTDSINSLFHDKVTVNYEFDMFLEPVSFLVEKGSYVSKYEPMIEGYDVEYYYEDQIYNFNQKIYEDISLYGKFLIKQYVVTFYDINGNILKTETVDHGQNATPPSVENSDENLEFLKWSSSFENITEDVSLYPIFVNKEADITFDAAGGNCEINYIYDYDSSMFDSLPIPYKKGYRFLGWYNKNKLFTKDDEIANPIILTAKYEAITYTITLDSKEGTCSEKSIKVVYDSKVTLPVCYHENKSFEGWFLDDKLILNEFIYNYDYNIELIAKYSNISSDFKFIENDTYIEILSYIGKNEHVVIPGSVNGKVVTAINVSTFENNFENIKSIRLPESVVDYDDGVLFPLINLEVLYISPDINARLINLFSSQIPDSLYTLNFIDDESFAFCYNFFYGVDKLFKIVFSSSVDKEPYSFDLSKYNNFIKEAVFEGNANFYNGRGMTFLEQVTVKSNNITYLDSSLLEDCLLLKSVELPNSITDLRQGVFKNCSSLSYISKLSNLEKIQNECFLGCTSLVNISLSNNIEIINSNAFKDCSNLKRVYFDGTVQEWKNIIFENEFSNPLYYADELYIDNQLVTDSSVYIN